MVIAMFDPVCMDTHPADLDALRKLVVEAAGFRAEPVVVEVGSWVGRTALALHSAIPGTKVFCVDHWRGSPHDATSNLSEKYTPEGLLNGFCKNTREHLFKTIFPLVGRSQFWASVWPMTVDLAFIDADHDYEAVKADIEAWSKHVKHDGILCGHDYQVFEGVTRAVEEVGFDGQVGACIWWKRIKKR